MDSIKNEFNYYKTCAKPFLQMYDMDLIYAPY